jgi:cardiolipin synthase
VELLLPAHSNHHLADWARHRALRTLVEAGARVRLVPHMLHAKLIIVDADWALAGSANLDSRSLFLNYELMVAFHAPDAVTAFADWYQHESINALTYVSHPPGLWRDLGEGLVLWLAFQL